MIRFGTLLCLAMGLVGCSSLPNEPYNHQSAFVSGLSKEEKELVQEQELKWGLALSGGGLRSSLFSIGAMKALYDSKKLDDVQIISSVSGGSYAAFWLYNRTSANGKDRFENAFGPDAFHQEACYLMTRGRFFSIPRGIESIFDYVDAYELALKRTYGKRVAPDHFPEQDPANNRKIGDIDQSPYLVVNATVLKPAPTGWANGLFEFTPLQRGNRSFGYFPWSANHDSHDSISFAKAVAISGAAVDFALKQEVQGLMSPEALPKEAKIQPQNASGSDGAAPPKASITLADGGHSENLGAVALIRRGVKNIIVIDSEYDVDYGFGAYANLKKRLQSWQGDVAIRELDDYLKAREMGVPAPVPRGPFSGTIDVDGKKTNLFYVKMQQPPKDIPAVSNPGEAKNDPLIARIEKTTKEGQWQCHEFGKSPEDHQLTPQYMSDFAARFYHWSNQESYACKMSRLIGESACFPQYTTFDQSFYVDQTIAFISLGYTLTLEMVEQKLK